MNILWYIHTMEQFGNKKKQAINIHNMGKSQEHMLGERNQT